MANSSNNSNSMINQKKIDEIKSKYQSEKTIYERAC